MRPRPVLLALLAGLLGSLVMSSAVLGAQPIREAVAFPTEGIDLDAGTACDFAVHIDALVNREYLTSFFDADGNLVRDSFNGSLMVRLTNVATGAWIDVNAGGPGGDTYLADGTILEDFNGHAIPLFDGVFYQTIGHHRYLTDADFNRLADVFHHGRIVDLCSQLG